MNHRNMSIVLLVAALGSGCSADAGRDSTGQSGGTGGSGAAAGDQGTGGVSGATGGVLGAAGAGGTAGTPGSGGLSGGGGFDAGTGGSTGGAAAGGVGGTSGAGGASGASGASGAGGLDANPTPESASTKGPYDVQSYKNGWADSPAYGAATIWHASNGPTPAPGVSVVPGFIETQLVGWGEFLASHGFIVITIDTNTPGDQPPTRAVAVMQGLETLKGEHARPGSPIAGKLDASRLAIAGHSMGGGGTLIAASASSAKLKAAIPLCPWNNGSTNLRSITVPTLIIAGQVDAIAPVSQHAGPFYQALSPTTTRAFVEIGAADHFIANNPLLNKVVARVALSWLKVYQQGDMRYAPFIATDPTMSRFSYNP